jgi:hypothetical protein
MLMGCVGNKYRYDVFAHPGGAVAVATLRHPVSLGLRSLCRISSLEKVRLLSRIGCNGSSRFVNRNNGVMTTPPAGHSDDAATDSANIRRPWDIPPGAAAVLVAVIGVVGVLAGRVTAPVNNSPAPRSTVTATVTSPPSPAAQVMFSLTANSPVPWCQAYGGTGTIPAGYSLVIFDTPAGPSGQLPFTAYYAFDSRATQSATGHWQTEPLQIGTEGGADTDVDIVAVLTTNSIYQYMNSIKTREDAPWISEVLPPGQEISLPVVTNGERGLPCHNS